MAALKRLDRWISSAVSACLVVAFGTMLVLAFLQVFLRICFHTGLVWGDVAARYLVLWVGFFGAYLAAGEKKHFHIDAVVRLLPTGPRLALSAVTNLFAAGVCGFMSKAAVTFLTVGIDAAASPFLNVPERAVAAIVPVGFGLLGLRFFIRSAEDITELRRGG